MSFMASGIRKSFDPLEQCREAAAITRVQYTVTISPQRGAVVLSAYA